MKLKSIFKLILSTFKNWNEDNVSHLAAALSYYTVFSLAPILVISIALSGLIFGRDIVGNQIINQIGETLGTSTANEIRYSIINIRNPSSGITATLLGFLVLAWGAVGLFSELQNCLNTIWAVQPKLHKHKWRGMFIEKFLSFIVVVCVGFLLLCSLLLSSVLATMNAHLHVYFKPVTTNMWMIWDFLISTSIATFLFAAIFKLLPDVILRWRDVFLGAFITAILFNFGKSLISLYLAKSNITTMYGAADSLVVLLIWVYYSAQILLLGVEFTKTYATRYGNLVKQKNTAAQD